MPDSETPKISVIARTFLVLEGVLAWWPCAWIALGLFLAGMDIPISGKIGALIFAAYYALKIDHMHAALTSKDQGHA